MQYQKMTLMALQSSQPYIYCISWLKDICFRSSQVWELSLGSRWSRYKAWVTLQNLKYFTSACRFSQPCNGSKVIFGTRFSYEKDRFFALTELFQSSIYMWIVISAGMQNVWANLGYLDICTKMLISSLLLIIGNTIALFWPLGTLLHYTCRSPAFRTCVIQTFFFSNFAE